MKSDKYSNGAYKTQSKEQEIASASILKSMQDLGTLDYMSINFDQITGNCEYQYAAKGKMTVYYIEVNRQGTIFNSGFTTR